MVGFAQIVSPGALVTLGIVRRPVVLGGPPKSPRLREVTTAGADPPRLGR